MKSDLAIIQLELVLLTTWNVVMAAIPGSEPFARKTKAVCIRATTGERSGRVIARIRDSNFNIEDDAKNSILEALTTLFQETGTKVTSVESVYDYLLSAIKSERYKLSDNKGHLTKLIEEEEPGGEAQRVTYQFTFEQNPHFIAQNQVPKREEV